MGRLSTTECTYLPTSLSKRGICSFMNMSIGTCLSKSSIGQYCFMGGAFGHETGRFCTPRRNSEKGLSGSLMPTTKITMRALGVVGIPAKTAKVAPIGAPKK